MSANEMQVGGQHYASTYQHWDFVWRALDNDYLVGNLTKYVARWRKKNGVQDLQKALHYLTKHIEITTAIGIPLRKRSDTDYSLYLNDARQFSAINGLGPEETRIMELAATWQTGADLVEMDRLIHVLLFEATAGDAAAAEPGPGYVAQG